MLTSRHPQHTCHRVGHVVRQQAAIKGVWVALTGDAGAICSEEGEGEGVDAPLALQAVLAVGDLDVAQWRRSTAGARIVDGQARVEVTAGRQVPFASGAGVNVWQKVDAFPAMRSRHAKLGNAEQKGTRQGKYMRPGVL